MILYQYHPSGNCYKIRLLLHHLNIPVQLVDVNTKAGETRTPEFRAKNPIGKVPTIELEPGVFLAESNAILWYFAEGTRYLPDDRLLRARVLQWMFFEQYSHEPYIAVARNWISYAGIPAGKEVELQERQEKGYMALDVMEDELRQKRFFVGERFSIADIALYAYTHVAHEGKFQLVRYPAIQAWMDQVASVPGHIQIDERISL